MVSLSVKVFRGKIIENKHEVASYVQKISGKELITTNNKLDLVFPRSAIKIFQAIPFIYSNSDIKFKLNEKNIAIACASHCGEPKHIRVLKNWVNKLNIGLSDLKCGIHNPIDIKSSNNLLLKGDKPSELHNNCAGKHLAMISGCIANNLNYKNYINYSHDYQYMIREVLEKFSESKIKKNCIGIDGCSAPQYAFTLQNLSNMMVNLIINKKNNSIFTKSINKLIASINKYPDLISGTNRFDTEIIRVTKGRLFCKGGAEGVVLFADFKKNIGGVIKVIDGNDRVKTSITMKIFSYLNILTKKEIKILNYWMNEKIFNHAGEKIGKIISEIE